jgi:hypothetical protein
VLRITTSPALKEKRLQGLLGPRREDDPSLRAAVEAAQVRGSLELAGLADAPAETVALRGALRAVDLRAPLSLGALGTWQAALTGGNGAWRTSEREREGGPPPAPARFVETRLQLLEQWLGEESSHELKPAQRGALVLARIIEVMPFESANGRVARLAASHVMVRAGARPPLLNGADDERLRAALQAAFQLHTEPLCALLDEASARAVDVMIAALED